MCNQHIRYHACNITPYCAPEAVLDSEEQPREVFPSDKRAHRIASLVTLSCSEEQQEREGGRPSFGAARRLRRRCRPPVCTRIFVVLARFEGRRTRNPTHWMLKESNIGMYEGTGTAIRHYKQNRGERGGKRMCMISTHAQAFKLMTGYRSGSVNERRRNSGWMEGVSRARES